MRARLALLVFISVLATACLRPSEQSPLPLGPDGAVVGLDGGVAVAIDAGSGPDASSGPADGSVRVVTFNTHLFFDTVCDSYACGGSNFESQATQEGFDARAEQISDALRSLTPTVALLQEVETQACLDALSERLGDILPVAVLGEIGYGGSVDVAVMAAGTLLEVRKHRNQEITRPDGSKTSFSREFLEVHLGFGASRVIVFAAHFRSKNNDDPGRRLAEAQAAAEIIAASTLEFPQALHVLGGDLNDTPGSDPLNALEASGKLLRVASELPPAQQITYTGFGGNALDHLYVDTSGGGRYLSGTARVVRDGNVGFGGSDHSALVADFALP